MKYYYWKDNNKCFRTETPFVEHYKGLSSSDVYEYAMYKIAEHKKNKASLDYMFNKY